MKRTAALCMLCAMLFAGCAGGPAAEVSSAPSQVQTAETESAAQPSGRNREQVTIPSMPATREEAARNAEAAGLSDVQELMGMTYRVNGDWKVTEQDNMAEGEMFSRIYTPSGADASLDVMGKGISLIELDALSEGKRNLGSVGQFQKQWESTYGISVTQDLTSDQLPPGADMGWAFESQSVGRGGQGVLLIAGQYMYAIYYAAERVQDNPFRGIWDAIVGSVSIEPQQTG